MCGILLIGCPAELHALGVNLQAEGFAVEFTEDALRGLTSALSGESKLVILDASPPGASGFEVLRRVRQHSLLPVLMLLPEARHADKVLALELGADDCLLKPYSPPELVARVRALLRRTVAGASAFGHLVRADDLELDRLRRAVRKSGEEITLTSSEFDLLELLLRRAGQPVSREEMARAIFGRQLNYNDRSIDMHVSNLRKKLGRGPRGAERIKAIRGVGYALTFAGQHD